MTKLKRIKPPDRKAEVFEQVLRKMRQAITEAISSGKLKQRDLDAWMRDRRKRR